jgi:hypothetical protein
MEHTNQLPEAAGLAIPRESTLKRIVQGVRKTHQQLPVAPATVAELILPHEYTVHSGYPFLLDDSGEGNERILIFGSPSGVQALQESTDFYSDGTFDSAPPLFAQFVTVHVERHDFVRPLIYALLPNKTQASYRRLYGRLSVLAPNMQPVRWMSDFERANMNAVLETFDVESTGCLFHPTQSVRRRAVSEGLRRQLEVPDGEFSLWLRCLPALAFCTAGISDCGV